MQKHYIWIALLFVLSGMDASAQSLKRKVIASGGGSLRNNQYQLSFTIGEPVIAKFKSTRYILSQGFQQPDWTAGAQNLMTFYGYAEENTGRFILVTLSNKETDFLVLERIDNQSGLFEEYEYRNITIGMNSLTQLSFTDLDPQDGDNFYRVKQVFSDGTSRYSEVQKLNFKTVALNLYPNPASDFVKVDLSSFIGGKAIISVFSTIGHQVVVQKVDNIGRQSINIPLDNIDPGYYQVLIQVEGKRTIAKQLIIAK
jgi:hypothetical protein